MAMAECKSDSEIVVLVAHCDRMTHLLLILLTKKGRFSQNYGIEVVWRVHPDRGCWLGEADDRGRFFLSDARTRYMQD